VYEKEGLDFLPRVKAMFPAGSKDDLSPAEVLAKLELVCRDFKPGQSR